MKLQVAALVLISAVTLPMMFWVQSGASTGNGGPLVVLVSPWTDPTDAIAAAGGSIVGPERGFFGVFAASDDPSFAMRLSKLGFKSFESRTLAQLFCGVPA